MEKNKDIEKRWTEIAKEQLLGKKIFELDFITCETMLSEGLSYEEARKQALQELKELREERRIK